MPQIEMKPCPERWPDDEQKTAREFAVQAVDCILGYTIEFSHDVRHHAYWYDRLEAALTYGCVDSARPTPISNGLEQMRAALEPFAKEFEDRRDAYIRRYPRHPAVGANNFDAMPDSWPMEKLTFTMGDLRRARQALEDCDAN
jgi:hypothetical protein